jgi:hypothetical protein
MTEIAVMRPGMWYPVMWLVVVLTCTVGSLAQFPAISGKVLIAATGISALLVGGYALKIATARIEITPDVVRYISSGLRREEIPRASLASLRRVSGVSVLPGSIQLTLDNGLPGMQLPDYWTRPQLARLSELLAIPLTYDR